MRTSVSGDGQGEEAISGGLDGVKLSKVLKIHDAWLMIAFVGAQSKYKRIVKGWKKTWSSLSRSF